MTNNCWMLPGKESLKIQDLNPFDSTHGKKKAFKKIDSQLHSH